MICGQGNQRPEAVERPPGDRKRRAGRPLSRTAASAATDRNGRKPDVKPATTAAGPFDRRPVD
jgi:hypothetical protein